MEIVFVRHGATAANGRRIHQRPSEPLHATGIAQVRETIAELEVWQPTHIISSPMTRAHTSASIIGVALDLPVEVREEFRELRRPFSLYGRHHFSVRSVWYMLRWFFRAFVHMNTVMEGESYPSLRRRIERARSILEQYPSDARIVIVSHSVFINFFVVHACDSDALSLVRAIPHFFRVITLGNARTTYLRYGPSTSETACAWQRAPETESSKQVA